MPSVSISFNFASGKAGLTTVGYEVFDSQWTSQGPRTQIGIHEAGSGVYTLSLPVLDGFVGFVRGDTGELNPRYDTVPVNFDLPLAPAPPLYESPPVFRSGDVAIVSFQGGDASLTPVPEEPDIDPPFVPLIAPIFSAG